MPMDFPDYSSIKRTGEIWKFRKPHKDESEEDYRNALADYVEPKDFIESQEIRNKVGWDQWSEDQKRDMLIRSGLNARSK
jgi:hypothetical protein